MCESAVVPAVLGKDWRNRALICALEHGGRRGGRRERRGEKEKKGREHVGIPGPQPG